MVDIYVVHGYNIDFLWGRHGLIQNYGLEDENFTILGKKWENGHFHQSFIICYWCIRIKTLLNHDGLGSEQKH